MKLTRKDYHDILWYSNEKDTLKFQTPITKYTKLKKAELILDGIIFLVMLFLLLYFPVLLRG